MKPGDVLGDGVEHGPRADSRGLALLVRREDGQALVPAVGQAPVLHPDDMVGELGVVLAIAVELGPPGRPQGAARLPIPSAKWARTSSGTSNLASSGQP